MMNYKLYILILLIMSSTASAQNRQQKARPKTAVKKAVPTARPQSSPRAVQVPQIADSNSQAKPNSKALEKALALVKAGQHAQAAVQLFTLSRKNDLIQERNQIKYILGLTLMELKLYQVAAFQFVGVIKDGESPYLRQAIEKLSILADLLGDDTLLNYAIGQVSIEEFPTASRDMLYFRLGEVKQRNGQLDDAIELYTRVPSRSIFFESSRYNRATALAEAGRLPEAKRAFSELIELRSEKPITDPVLNMARLGLARTHYQAEEWDASLAMYRNIPRDSEFWHEAGFEMTWAMLRAAKFRSALSSFVSLHSPFYDDFYLPESLLVRSIIYLFVCKYDESEKVIDQFEKTYAPIRVKITEFLKSNRDSGEYFNEIEKARIIKSGRKPRSQIRIPYSVARHVMNEGDIRRAMDYLQRLKREKARLEKAALGRTPLGQYGIRLLVTRIQNTRSSVGEMVKNHLIEVRAELKDLYEQSTFIRFEMVNGRKEALKKKIDRKDIPIEEIEQALSAKFNVQNGYELWPFAGEFWKDELWNFQYLGRQNCE